MQKKYKHTIRMFEPPDLIQVREIERHAWESEAASREMIMSRHEVFPEGSIVAEDEKTGLVFGYVVVQRTDQFTNDSWSVQTDHGKIVNTHRPNGRVVYGVNMSMLGTYAHTKTGRAFLDHIHEYFVVHGDAQSFSLGSRMPFFKKWAAKQGNANTDQLAQEYWKLTRTSGKYQDGEIQYYRERGFRPVSLIQDYFPDEGSHNYGVHMVHV